MPDNRDAPLIILFFFFQTVIFPNSMENVLHYKMYLLFSIHKYVHEVRTMHCHSILFVRDVDYRNLTENKMLRSSGNSNC